ncbi:MAG: hypothetical protein ACI379_00695 [Nocardioides sp.]|uniref:hypothetical protein n=1 Tax=Nocardioides sp. TaxID=35761 RepID=UPI003F1298D7
MKIDQFTTDHDVRRAVAAAGLHDDVWPVRDSEGGRAVVALTDEGVRTFTTGNDLTYAWVDLQRAWVTPESIELELASADDPVVLHLAKADYVRELGEELRRRSVHVEEAPAPYLQDATADAQPADVAGPHSLLWTLLLCGALAQVAGLAMFRSAAGEVGGDAIVGIVVSSLVTIGGGAAFGVAVIGFGVMLGMRAALPSTTSDSDS